jgi:hypothetical protein
MEPPVLLAKLHNGFADARRNPLQVLAVLLEIELGLPFRH